MLKKNVIALYFVVVVVMAAATIVEKYQGTSYVSEHIYGSWWFSALWALLTALAVFHFIRRRVRRASTVALHLSFVVILAGALLTHLTSRKGVVHLRQGQTVSHYLTEDLQQHPLPFSIRLDRFEVHYHEGTDAHSDYVSHLTMDHQPYVVSMNQIASHQGIRLYQSSYDSDLQGSILALNSDPWGIPVTYCGYALLFVSLLWILIDPRGTYRQLLRRAAAVAVAALFTIPASAGPRVLPEETAARFGRLFVVYNDRVSPMQTYALDFTKKLYGKRSYEGYTAEQVFTGFIFFYDDWTREPLIKIKDSEMKHRLNLPDYASHSTFFTRNGYTLGPYLQHKDVAKIDEKVILIMELHQGRPLKIFPYQDSLRLTWYSPTSTLPADMDAEHQKYMREVFTLLNGEVHAGRYEVVNQYLDKLLLYQQTFGRQSLPVSYRVEAELIYNKVAFATVLFMVCLTLGFLLFGVSIWRPQWLRSWLPLALLLCAFLVLTFCLALRWIITGVIPMSNGYETMLFLAWSVQLLAMLMSRRFPIMLTFGFLLSGFFLLVSHISQMDPQMTHLMPVLNSPLLTVHVSVIMMSFALLSLTFICGVTALLFRKKSDELQLLSQLMLYPALTFLGFGIFIGAIWANVSWGTYWSWDPKEVWALITLIIYALPLHNKSLPMFSKPLFFHGYCIIAFLSVLITYFGVNFILGGMHSYA